MSKHITQYISVFFILLSSQYLQSQEIINENPVSNTSIVLTPDSTKNTSNINNDQNTLTEFAQKPTNIQTEQLGVDPVPERSSALERQPLNFEFGGTLIWTNISVENTNVTQFAVEPSIVKYFSSVYIGPVMRIQMQWQKYDYSDYESETDFFGSFLFGAKIGAITGKSTMVALPFIESGFTSISGTSGQSDRGLAIPISTGVKIRIAPSTLLTVSFNYVFMSIASSQANSFALGIGFSGYR
jgi:hypothetical protein